MKTHTPCHRPPQRDTATGFSITETLIAMAIFAMGFAAVASIFPVGAILQKNTADSVLAQQTAANARALITARKFKHTFLNGDVPPTGYTANDYLPEDYKVHPVLLTQPNGNMLAVPGRFAPGEFERWTLNDRSYFFVRESVGYHPKQTLELATTASEFNRSFYWVPLICRTNVPTTRSDWRVFVFVLRGGEPAHSDYGYDRQGVTSNLADKSWANYDGFLSPRWHVPGVHRTPVTVVPPDRFNFTGWNENRYGTESASALTAAGQHEVQVGDQVLDNNGTIHTVLSADDTGITVKVYNDGITSIPIPQRLDTDGITLLPNALWYGRPPAAGSTSPTELIIEIVDAVE